jgi:hypothetical protein
MTVRKDHVAGGAFVVAGALILAVSADLPFGTLASPGAGMLPTLVIGLMMAFGLVLFVQARRSPPLAEVGWSDLPHALRVVLVAAAATAVYTTAGFLLVMPLLLLALTFLVERRAILPALAFSIGVAGLAYLLLGQFLRTPLPRGVIWL